MLYYACGGEESALKWNEDSDEELPPLQRKPSEIEEVD